MTNDEAKSVLFDMLGKGIYVKNTKENQAILAGLRALEQEPCEDAVSRQAALDAFGLSEKSRKYGGDHSGYDTIMLYEVQDALEALPSVQPQPKIGHWIRWYEQKENDGCIEYIPHCKCSECGKEYDPHSSQFVKYCNECGAKMIEPQESEE